MQSGITVPRAPLHKETIYGRILVPDGEKKLKFAIENLNLIVNPKLRLQLEDRLKHFGGDKTLTLKDLKKNPLTFNGKIVETVKCFHEECVVRYPIESIKFSDVRYIVDSHIRELVEERFTEVGNNDKDFQKSLAVRPLCSDKNGNHRIRTIRLFAKLKMPTLACVRRNEAGEVIGYAQKRNNHHVAFYRNSDGKIVESVVSFWDCVKRKKAGLPIIIKDTAKAWDTLLSLGDNIDVEELAATMPQPGSEFLMSLQRNEMVLLGMSDDEYNDAVASNDIPILTRHLYRVWKLSAGEYCFKYQTNTSAAPENGDKEIKQHYIISSISSLLALHPRKVKVSLLGKIILPSDDKENSML